MVALPAQQRAQPVVPETFRRRGPAHAPHRHRGAGAAIADCSVALPRRRVRQHPVVIVGRSLFETVLRLVKDRELYGMSHPRSCIKVPRRMKRLPPLHVGVDETHEQRKPREVVLRCAGPGNHDGFTQCPAPRKCSSPSIHALESRPMSTFVIQPSIGSALLPVCVTIRSWQPFWSSIFFFASATEALSGM